MRTTSRNATSNAVQFLLQAPYHITVAVYNEYSPVVAELLRPVYALAVRVLSLITSVAAIIAIHLVRDVLAGIGTCGMVSTNRVTDAYASPLGWGSTDTPNVVNAYAPLAEVVEEPSYRLTDSDILEALEAQPFDMPMSADDYSDEPAMTMVVEYSGDHSAHVDAFDIEEDREEYEACMAREAIFETTFTHRPAVHVELDSFNAAFPLPTNPDAPESCTIDALASIVARNDAADAVARESEVKEIQRRKASSKPSKARSPRKVKPGSKADQTAKRNADIVAGHTQRGYSVAELADAYKLSVRTVQGIIKKAKGS